jgi:hypothetical protein
MKTTTIFGLALLAAFSLARPCSADITYTLSDYSALESGYTLTGSITTDGNFGTIVAGDIESWTFTATDGETTYTVSSNDAYASLGVDGLQASATALTMGIPTPASTGEAALDLYAYGESYLSYQRYTNYYGFLTQDTYSFDNPSQNSVWTNQTNGSNGLTLGANDPWTIATAPAAVPEPSSLVMAGLGLAGLAGYGWRRRRAGV